MRGLELKICSVLQPSRQARSAAGFDASGGGGVNADAARRRLRPVLRGRDQLEDVSFGLVADFLDGSGHEEIVRRAR